MLSPRGRADGGELGHGGEEGEASHGDWVARSFAGKGQQEG